MRGQKRKKGGHHARKEGRIGEKPSDKREVGRNISSEKVSLIRGKDGVRIRLFLAPGNSSSENTPAGKSGS